MEAEFDALLGYIKNYKGDVGTADKHNEHLPKTLKSQYGEFQIGIPEHNNVNLSQSLFKNLKGYF